MHHFFRFIWHIPRNLLIGLMRFYQKTFSPDHSFWAKTFFPGGYCQFQPTCSQYMVDSLKKHGFFYGFFKGFYRVLRCNPCSKGGVDEA